MDTTTLVLAKKYTDTAIEAAALDGVDGKAATITVGTVTEGETASVVNSGTTSAAIFDFVLPKGDTGAAGTNGINGKDGAAGATGPAGASITAIELVKDATGNITGGTATLSDNSTIAITITTVE